MKKIFLFLFLVYSSSFAYTVEQAKNQVANRVCQNVFFTHGDTEVDSSFCNPTYSVSKALVLGPGSDFQTGWKVQTRYVDTLRADGSTRRTCNQESSSTTYQYCQSMPNPNPSLCPSNPYSDQNGKIFECNPENGEWHQNVNPDPLQDPSGRCRSLFQKDGQAYSCNPDTNEATLIPNSDGVTIDPEDGRDVPNCKSGYTWSSMGAGGTYTDVSPTHTVYSCIPSSSTGSGLGDTGGATNPNVGTVTNPDGTTTTTLPDGTTHTYYPSSQTTVTRYPSGEEKTTYHNNSNGGTDSGSGSSTGGTDSGSGSSTGGTSGTGTTGGTTGTNTGTGTSGGTTGTTDGGSTGGTSSSGGVGSSTTTGGTGSTGGTTGTNTGTGTSGGTTTTTPPTTETGAGNCNDSNLTLQEKMLCELNKSNDLTNSKLTTSNTHLNSIDKSLGSINSNLQDENGKSYLENISDFVTTFTAPVSEDTKASYSSQINSKVTSALNDSFTKYSNVLGFGSDYGNRPENITLTLFNQQYTLIDFSLLDPFVSIIRSLFLTLAYLYGFMNLLKGDK